MERETSRMGLGLITALMAFMVTLVTSAAPPPPVVTPTNGIPPGWTVEIMTGSRQMMESNIIGGKLETWVAKKTFVGYTQKYPNDWWKAYYKVNGMELLNEIITHPLTAPLADYLLTVDSLLYNLIQPPSVRLYEDRTILVPESGSEYNTKGNMGLLVKVSAPTNAVPQLVNVQWQFKLQSLIATNGVYPPPKVVYRSSSLVFPRDFPYYLSTNSNPQVRVAEVWPVLASDKGLNMQVILGRTPVITVGKIPPP